MPGQMLEAEEGLDDSEYMADAIARVSNAHDSVATVTIRVV